jgi:predicted heme/steroid binding protein
MSEKSFTENELRRYTGEDGGPMYIAYQGIVYDVSGCPKWRKGMHENLHYPGQDLSTELQDAPHQADVFTRPCVNRIGIFIEEHR